MTRLRHSHRALLRVMDISDRQVFAFCEGVKNDRYFYVRARCTLSHADFDKRFLAVERWIRGLASSEKLFSIFKGKWLAPVLEEQLRSSFAGRPANIGGVASRIVAVATARLDFTRPWAQSYVQRIVALTNVLSQ